MKSPTVRMLKHVAKALLYGAVGGGVVTIVGYIWYLESRPDLKLWHTADLDAEYTPDDSIKSFKDYLELEDRLFAQLDDRVYSRVSSGDRSDINRFNRGSRSDPNRWRPNWNRTFELFADDPIAGVLLLHGMSDSPYSLRGLGLRLNEMGAYITGLRLPGHGTAPVSLARVKWEHMDDIVRLAVRHVRDSVGEKPIFIVGYSTGGALAVNYALSSLNDSRLPSVNGIVLISPAIGVTPVAALAKWQARLGRLLGLDKLAWRSILPEYDPFKYNSFAVNAGDQVHRLTSEIKKRVDAAGSAGQLARFPKVLAFQSVVDATVSTSAVVSGIFDKLPAAGNELVLFDVNYSSRALNMVKKDPSSEISALMSEKNLPFIVSLVTNGNEESPEAVVRSKHPGGSSITETPLGLKWPENVFSLAHVALPFSENDSLYGGSPSAASPGIWLGSVALFGEKGVLAISGADFLRLRWNPFYPYLERRLVNFIIP